MHNFLTRLFFKTCLYIAIGFSAKIQRKHSNRLILYTYYVYLGLWNTLHDISV